MMKSCFAAALALLLSVPAFADTAEKVVEKGNCQICHARTQKGAVPGWTNIAAKYAGDKGAQARLEAKVRNGGGGSFGSMPMPATPRTINDGEIRTAVYWVLNQK